MKFYTDEDLINRKIRLEKINNKVKLIVIILIIVLICYNVSLIVQGFMVPDKIPSVFGYKSFTIISGSMEPAISVGDVVITRDVSEQEIRVGSVISYRENSSIVTHRVDSIEEIGGEKYYTTKGDNNNVDDENVIKYNVIEGKVVKIIPNLGTITIFLKDKVVILYIFVIFFFAFLKDKNKEDKEKIRREKKDIYLKKFEEETKKLAKEEMR